MRWYQGSVLRKGGEKTKALSGGLPLGLLRNFCRELRRDTWLHQEALCGAPADALGQTSPDICTYSDTYPCHDKSVL